MESASILECCPQRSNKPESRGSCRSRDRRCQRTNGNSSYIFSAEKWSVIIKYSRVWKWCRTFSTNFFDLKVRHMTCPRSFCVEPSGQLPPGAFPRQVRLSLVPVYSWHRPRVEGAWFNSNVYKEKDHDIHFHSFHTSRKGCDPQTRVGWTADDRSCSAGESCRAYTRGQLLRRGFELPVLADTCCHQHYSRLLDVGPARLCAGRSYKPPSGSDFSDRGRCGPACLVSESPPAPGWLVASCTGYEPAHLLDDDRHAHCLSAHRCQPADNARRRACSAPRPRILCIEVHQEVYSHHDCTYSTDHRWYCRAVRPGAWPST